MSVTAKNNWNNINEVVVVGLGITGLSVVNHLLRQEKPLNIRVIDTRENPPGLERLADSVELHSGSWNEHWLAEADLIVANPGIALATPEIQTAIKLGIPVVGDIELFGWAVTKPVVAITGSNGKSTVTDLTGVMANAAGCKTKVGGNIGVPALDLLLEDADLYVLELSSFQLETTSNLSLKAAAYLNLTEDHMDRYDDLAAYGNAKQRIFLNVEKAIVNQQDSSTHPFSGFEGQVVTFAPSQADYQLKNVEGTTYLSKGEDAFISTSSLSIVGQHNSMNALVAMALLDAVGIDFKKAENALKSYTGLTHRCQVVAKSHGVTWVNDSKATNLASTLAALSGLQCDGTLHLLVGGDGKGADFSELEPMLAELPVQLHCYGRDGSDFMNLHSSAKRWESIDDVLENIAADLDKGDIVMLSPACASFDQYPNFMTRGDAFTKLAQHYASS
ncbi:UDP-N-acetylmuramoylalanine--D-glutamate ligase [Vibrio nigripulchritudo MADA3029]|uniref:UDP-N-acetylmuramoyl-L-alanine--D-glutamate ligase n=1 Tax=Vibrio nigripulchritudo TaxID=28173 RepID=UPI0003B20963|nr:UDP-N-acetylmuramoyl-L-alanine--D-glutamate ligase [Vibrio nigripulchritudo]CCN47186.1 UDP-N-acetylmuramoylalanine--D-glutamate ligase [Vibrio nigripulchritudo MADA3020]CCN55442.1 UDP-N-acetylmuramoylalanine--D-glutamate ligase [Vibrio nigripulchritudo MADA3021]CCN60396.1 UDP-N-acetylmuramoylalanine--D-glutamate ligase [Vibrio nigripulchritudo MADA3029]